MLRKTVLAMLPSALFLTLAVCLGFSTASADERHARNAGRVAPSPLPNAPPVVQSQAPVEPQQADSKEQESSTAGPVLGDRVQTFQVRLGLRVSAEQGDCNNIRCGFPLPVNWPEQEVKIVKTEKSKPLKGVMIREVGGGVRQAGFLIPRLARGQSVELIYTLQVRRRSLAPPQHLGDYSSPQTATVALRAYLGSSPYIETTHPFVIAEAEKLDLAELDNDWEKVKAIREHTFRRVRYTGVKALQGALRGLQSGGGDCEERTSVFVALCRLKGIPARSVWIPGHAYAEFYLQDANGRGHWFPCESVGGRLGWQRDDFLILQKGDRFRDPLKRGLQRYLTETASGKLGRGSAAPTLRPVREIIDEKGNRRALK